jgi:RNA polymerase sigma factor for flagellar operon FliA
MYNAAGQINKEQLVRSALRAALVKRIACHLMARLPASVLLDDLVQNGMLGLLDAIGRFEVGVGAQFEAYAAQRVRGAMLDSLRENDWLPRSLRRSCRLIEAAIAQLQQQTGRAPTEKSSPTLST